MNSSANRRNGLVSKREVARLKRIRSRQRVLQIALSVVAGIAAFVLGAVTRDVITGAATYPYATGAAASAAGIGLERSSASENRLVLVVIGALCVVMFTLGVLLTEGHTESTAPSLGVAPEYGVFHS